MDRIIDDAVRKPSGEKDGERGLFLLGRFSERESMQPLYRMGQRSWGRKLGGRTQLR